MSERRDRCVAMSRVVGLQWIGNAVVMLLAILWLQIPDSHTWQFCFSVVSAVGIAWLFVWLTTVTFRRLRLSDPSVPMWLSALFLAAVLLVWMGLSHPIAAGREHEFLSAGYWNSKLSPGLRYRFTYMRLVELQDRFYDLVELVIAALLLPLAIELMTSGARGLRRVVYVYRRWRYWVVAAVAGVGAMWITRLLLNWTPGHSVRGQVLSVVARVGVAYTVDVVFWCLVVAVAARYMRD
jgi:hypothetical protein